MSLGKGNGMPRKALQALPAFKTEAEERTFWKAHDATDYLNLSKPHPLLARVLNK